MRYLRPHSFSMVEALIVITLLLVIASLISPSIKNLTEHGHSRGCQTQLRMVYAAILMYTNDHDDQFPGPSFISQKAVFLGRNGVYKDNIARYIRPYMDQVFDNDGRGYLPDFHCPSNKYHPDLIRYPHQRVNFRTTGIRRVGRPFGYPQRSWSTYRVPLTFHRIPFPSTNWMLCDADRQNAGWINENLAPDTPIHLNNSRNYLYYDGSVKNREIE